VTITVYTSFWNTVGGKCTIAALVVGPVVLCAGCAACIFCACKRSSRRISAPVTANNIIIQTPPLPPAPVQIIPLPAIAVASPQHVVIPMPVMTPVISQPSFVLHRQSFPQPVQSAMPGSARFSTRLDSQFSPLQTAELPSAVSPEYIEMKQLQQMEHQLEVT